VSDRNSNQTRQNTERRGIIMLGMSLTTFTLLHVLISLIGIVAGLIAMIGWSDPSRIPTAIFLATTILTSVTGFLFPFTKLLPSHIVGIISLVMLALFRHLAPGLYRHRDAGVVPECVRIDYSVVPENPTSKAMGADADRAAVPGRPENGIPSGAAADRPYYHKISAGSACCLLTC
jgi:hypothetical protein